MSSPALRRVADEITRTAGTSQRLRITTGTIATVVAGGGTDGADTYTVTIGADTIPAGRYASTTTLRAGDLVHILLVDSSPIILGRPSGLPAI